MLTEIKHYQEIEKTLKLDYPRLTDFERLSLAVQIERNQLLENGLNISRTDESPASLEAIAIALGFEKEKPLRKGKYGIS